MLQKTIKKLSHGEYLDEIEQMQLISEIDRLSPRSIVQRVKDDIIDRVNTFKADESVLREVLAEVIRDLCKD